MSIRLKTSLAPFVQLTTVLDRNWLLVFHQNASVGLFEKPEDAIFSLREGMYSILSEIKEKWKIDQKYEFMLDYPSLGKRNIWRQSLNPIDDYEEERPNSKTAVGYEQISIDMTTLGWGGLVRSSHSSSFLDGSVNKVEVDGSYWYYSIGTCDLFRGGIPADGNCVQNAYLWIRFNSLKFIPHSVREYFGSFIGVTFALVSG